MCPTERLPNPKHIVCHLHKQSHRFKQLLHYGETKLERKSVSNESPQSGYTPVTWQDLHNPI